MSVGKWRDNERDRVSSSKRILSRAYALEHRRMLVRVHVCCCIKREFRRSVCKTLLCSIDALESLDDQQKLFLFGSRC